MSDREKRPLLESLVRQHCKVGITPHSSHQLRFLQNNISAHFKNFFRTYEQNSSQANPHFKKMKISPHSTSEHTLCSINSKILNPRFSFMMSNIVLVCVIAHLHIHSGHVHIY